ncbi:MAG: ribokinase [Solirubrobacteraceae bacterium]
MRARPHVVVVGSVMTDMTVTLDRMPAAGETLVGDSFLLGFGGKGANQAVMASLLGARVSMIACVGVDTFGADAIENLRSLDVDVRGVAELDGVATGVAPILVEDSGENRIVIVPGANGLMSVAHVEESMAAVGAADVVICQLEIPLDCVRRALELGHDQQALTILNPAPFAEDAFDLLALADWIIPNELEFDALSRTVLGVDGELLADSLEERLGPVSERLGVAILMTDGPRGAVLGGAGSHAVERLAAPAATVRDTSGAGDAFVGAFAYGLACFSTPLASAEMAVECATLTVEARGTQASFAQAIRRLRDADGRPDGAQLGRAGSTRASGA